LALAHIRPAEFVRFRTDSGVIALDVGRVGPDAEDFDEFVDLLIAQIESARAGAEPAAEPRLYGTWRSDAVGTIEHLRNEPQCSEKALAAIASLVGKLRVTFGPDAVTFECCELDGTYTYRVVKRSNRGVVVEITSGSWKGGRRRSTITFAEDGYWVDGPD